jgi:uncharacterized protein YegJ (DUF2314 family)
MRSDVVDLRNAVRRQPRKGSSVSYQLLAWRLLFRLTLADPKRSHSLFKVLLAATVASFTVLAAASSGSTPPVPSGELQSKSISLVLAIYYPEAPSSEPVARLRALLANERQAPKLVSTRSKIIKEPVVAATWLKNARKDYPAPSQELIQRFGYGLSKDQASALQQTDRALILDFSQPAARSLDAYRTALQITENLARTTGGLIWDEETREMFSPDAWHDRRLDTWANGLPDVSKHTVIHAYRGDTMVRAITLGMAKFGVPDVVVNDFSWASSRPVGNLIVAFSQVLVEGQFPERSGEFNLDLRSIRHPEQRKSQTSDLKANASSIARLGLVQGKWETGDPRNRLIEIEFERYQGPDRYAKQAAMLGTLYGYEDEAKRLRHSAELLAASKAAIARLPAVRDAFQRGLEPGEFVQVKAPFATPTGGTEWMWVEVMKWNGDAIEGLLRNEPKEISTLHAGQIVKVSESKVFDYLRRFPNGKEEGNETSKVIRRMQDVGR